MQHDADRQFQRHAMADADVDRSDAAPRPQRNADFRPIIRIEDGNVGTAFVAERVQITSSVAVADSLSSIVVESSTTTAT